MTYFVTVAILAQGTLSGRCVRRRPFWVQNPRGPFLCSVDISGGLKKGLKGDKVLIWSRNPLYMNFEEFLAIWGKKHISEPCLVLSFGVRIILYYIKYNIYKKCRKRRRGLKWTSSARLTMKLVGPSRSFAWGGEGDWRHELGWKGGQLSVEPPHEQRLCWYSLRTTHLES